MTTLVSNINGININNVNKIMGISISNAGYFMGISLATPEFPVGWGSKQKLIIDSTYIDEELINFPIKLDENCLNSEIFDADGQYCAVNGGDDIRFSSDEAGTTQLACEIVSFVTDNDPSNGSAEMYVKIPTVSSGIDTEFWVWYHNVGMSQVEADSAYGSKNVWDSSFKFVSHMEDREDLKYVSDQLTGLVNNSAWQGVGTDGTYLYVTTSLNASSHLENSVRKYRISDSELVASNIDAYSNSYAFSSCNVIDGKLMVAIRGDVGDEDWGHVVEYDLDTLTQIADHDVSLEDYWLAEGVDKRNDEYWVMYGGKNAHGNDKCAVARYNSSWVHQETYDLFTLSAGYGYQDLWWDGNYMYGNIHEGNSTESFDKWYFDGTTFTKVRSYTPIADNGALAGQGFCYLNGYWYFAGRSSDKIMKAELTTTNSTYATESAENNIDVKKNSIDNPVSVSGAQDFSSDTLEIIPKTALQLNTVTIECFINPDAFLSADEGKNTLVFLQGGHMLQVRGNPGYVGKIATYTGLASISKGYYYSSSALSTGVDKYIAYRYTGAKVYVNFDGVLEIDEDATGTVTFGGAISTYNMSIGAEYSASKYRYFNGKIMEVRVSAGDRSDAWINASRITIETPGTLITASE